jgi:hypothetical protein
MHKVLVLAILMVSVLVSLAGNSSPVRAQQASPTPAVTAVATTTSPIFGTILSGSVPLSGLGLITWGGGSRTQLVAASRCTEPTLTFWFTSGGDFITFLPATTVSAVNAAFEVAYGTSIPPLTPILARCTVPGGLDGYKNANCRIGGTDVQLVNGLAEAPAAPGSGSTIVTRVFGNAAFGDLTNDGRVDVGFLLTQNLGGSGTFYYAAAATRAGDGGWVGTNAILLGDRIAPQATEIRLSSLIVNYADRKPGEPFTTQPSVGTTKHFVVFNGALVETLRPGTID